MENKSPNINTGISESMRLIFKGSFIVTATFCFILLIAKLAGLEAVTELRFINYLLLYFIVYAFIRKLYVSHGNKIEYFAGFSVSFLISVLGQLWFSILFYFYLLANNDLLSKILTKFPGMVVNPALSIAFVLLIEGIAIGLIVALAIMQYFKRKRGRWATTNK